MKNDLINNIDKILHNFNYLINFEKYANESNDHEVGDLILGSVYGVYIAIESIELRSNVKALIGK